MIFFRSLFGFYIRKVLIFNRMKAKPDVMRPEIMHGLGVSLVLKFPKMNEPEPTEEEETHVAGLNRSVNSQYSTPLKYRSGH